MIHYYKMERSIEEMDKLIENNQAINATFGGLVMGDSHDDGGIYFWIKKGNSYVLEGELEGFEFILNFGATNYFQKATERFHQPDLHKPDFSEYTPDQEIKLIDTRSLKYLKYLIFESGGFSIINKYSTKGYLKTLDRLNKATSFEKVDEKTAKLVHHLNEDIEIYYYSEYEGYLPKR